MLNIRTHVQDSFYALIVTYLKLSSRDIFTDFDPAWNGVDRIVVVNGITFPVVVKAIGEDNEVPGVNVQFWEETPIYGNTNRPLNRRLATVSLYMEASDNIAADNLTLLKLQRSIDEALYGSGVSIIDFYASPRVKLGGAVSWGILTPRESWQEMTALDLTSLLLRRKSVNLAYADATLS